MIEQLDQNVDFMLLEPSRVNCKDKYVITINGESISFQERRINIKNYLTTKFKNYEEMTNALEHFKTFLIDFEDGSIVLLEDSSKNEIDFKRKAITESDIKKHNLNTVNEHEIGYKTYAPKNPLLNRILSKSDKGMPWKNLRRY